MVKERCRHFPDEKVRRPHFGEVHGEDSGDAVEEALLLWVAVQGKGRPKKMFAQERLTLPPPQTSICAACPI